MTGKFPTKSKIAQYSKSGRRIKKNRKYKNTSDDSSCIEARDKKKIYDGLLLENEAKEKSDGSSDSSNDEDSEASVDDNLIEDSPVEDDHGNVHTESHL